jgi:hypothetical protein
MDLLFLKQAGTLHAAEFVAKSSSMLVDERPDRWPAQLCRQPHVEDLH